MGMALSMDVARRLNDARGMLAVMDLDAIREATGETDDLVLPLLARTEIAFLEALLHDPGALFGPMPPLGTVSLSSPVPVPFHSTNAPTSDAPLLSVAAANWRAIKIREGWTDVRMLPLVDTAVALLIEICGDKLIGEYRRADVTDYKDILSRLPKHRFKKQATRHLDARRAAEVEGLPIIDLKTANDYIKTIVALFDWAKMSFEGVGNPFDGSTFNIKTDQREEKDPFSLEDLKAIFGGLERGDIAKFWAPVLALYTGGRSQEILKLKVTDVRQEDETQIWCLDINEDTHADVFNVSGKSVHVHHKLKRSSHKRRIPIHPDLVALGFLDLVKRSKGERIFNERKPNSAGKFSDAFGKWFNRHLKIVGVKRPKLDFHSFRHNFVDACDGRMPDDIIKRLKGDARGGTLDRYGKGKTEIEILAEHLAHMKVKGRELVHLRGRCASS